MAYVTLNGVKGLYEAKMLRSAQRDSIKQISMNKGISGLSC